MASNNKTIRPSGTEEVVISGSIRINGQAVTQADMRMANAVLTNILTAPSLDWDAITRQCNLANPKTARERWRTIKNKFGWMPGRASGSDVQALGLTSCPGGGAGSPKPTTPRTGARSSRKRTKAESPSDSDSSGDYMYNPSETDEDGMEIPAVARKRKAAISFEDEGVPCAKQTDTSVAASKRKGKGATNGKAPTALRKQQKELATPFPDSGMSNALSIKERENSAHFNSSDYCI
ncbi:hypothetical protein VTK73DRAFT_39 [Phialemonium thermophilum]|uniref:Myb-like domain-containing protein n=1 Tax=Phialemonium thermophilum TaxID=223376 RepID=A0ABR3Y8U1_9PEZI